MKKKYNHSIQNDNPKVLSKSLNLLLEKINDLPEKNLIETLILRSMAKAKYSSKNIGHYGLAFNNYSHFTSPIRRYPDLIVHRLMYGYLKSSPVRNLDLSYVCKHCSEKEKEAALAEPTAVALHAVLLAEANLKKRLSECKILIQGAGAIGLLCGLVLNKEKNSNNIIMSDPNKKRLDECRKYLKASFVAPDDKSIKENHFDLILESVGLEITRHQAINSIAPGGTIVHIGLTQPSGTFNFKKLTIQEVTLVGTYCYTNDDFKNSLVILKDKKLGDLGWIEYRDLKKGSDAFQEIHNGTCVAPKIILIP